MHNRHLKYLLVTLLILLSFNVNGQNRSRLDVMRAGKLFDNFEYAAAAKIYERLVARDSSFNYAKLQLAESYRKMNMPEQALPFYAEIVSDSSVSKPIHTLYYAQALMSAQRYDRALTALSNFYRSQGDVRATNLTNGITNFEGFYSDSSYYKINLSPFNSEADDYSPTYFQDGLVFSSNRKKFRLVKRTHGWNNMNFHELYFTNPGIDSVKTTKLFNKKLNTRYHEGPMVFYDSDEKAFFTRNNYNGKKVGTASDETINLQLYMTQRSGINAEWDKPVSFEYNSKEFSTGHPTMTEDETTLYFASNRPGGNGGVDIYKSTFDNGTWGEPENLGSEINTPGDEMFPHIHKGVLYFSSNGHYGMGGLDVYQYDLNDTAAFVKNMGIPVNSPKDDFGLIISKDDTTGYFTSNRPGGIGNDDIYQIEINIPKRPKQVFLKGIVVDQRSGRPLDDTEVFLSTGEGDSVRFITNADGGFEYELAWDQSYNLRAQKPDWSVGLDSASTFNDALDKEFITIPLRELLVIKGDLITPAGRPVDDALVTFTETTTGEVDSVRTNENGLLYFIAQPDSEYDVFLQKTGYFNFRTKVATGNDPGGSIKFDLEMDEIIIGKAIRIENIYFDLNKSEIRPDAAIELDKIVAMMTDNPTITIELGSHTDSRGGDPYNLALSDRRARSSAAYIVSKGIGEDRIIGKGYGETQLTNQCEDGIRCQPEEHQANRRTEFKVVSF
ncbi:OmpA family protein [Roseivirga sp.]|uniref:OmpA family protein n=1 Tax=Roseivirga sp. TaxID=1964215 RepID=UPI003B8CE8F4